MKIVIAGLGKSGTTGLFFKIKNSLSSGARCLFEPDRYALLAEDRELTVLAKILLYRPDRVDYGSFEGFDKKILIVRDPRDRLISQLLYEIWNSFYGDKKKVSRFLNLLEKKESDPFAVSVLDILGLIKKNKKHNFWRNPKLSKVREKSKELRFWISDLYGRRFNLSMDFHDSRPDYFLIKYEDFLAGRIRELEGYLGFRLFAAPRVDEEYSRVARTQKSGNWKNWFLKRDIKFFRPRFLNFMEKYGYSDDWELNKKPKILPVHSSGYVKRLSEERRKADLPSGNKKSKFA
jgi:hypothetical protein